MSFEKKVFESILKYDLLKNGDSVLIALSGGPDSVALLRVLARFRRKLKLKVSAVYINHRIRPNAAKKEEKFCAELCSKLNVRFVSVSEDIPKLSNKLKKGIEETGRDFRYEKFTEIANELKCNKIALGHHIDDRVETILFRILRGTGSTGLKGIPVKRSKFIRPLYDVTKKEILKFLRSSKYKFCTDRSNATVEYKRNYIRNRLLPLIRKEINSNIDGALLNLSETIAAEDIYLEEIVAKAFDKCVTHTPGGKLIVALTAFNNYDLWVQRRLVRRCLTDVSGSGGFPDKITVERVLEVANGSKKGVSVPPKIECQKIHDSLYIFEKRKLSFLSKLKVPGTTSVVSAGLKIVSKIVKNANVTRNRRSQNVIVDLNKISGKLLVRNIKTGDRFQPLGMKGSKKVGDYLTDRKVETVLRNEIPVIADGRGIVWLGGFEIDERVKVNGNTKEALQIELNYNS